LFIGHLVWCVSLSVHVSSCHERTPAFHGHHSITVKAVYVLQLKERHLTCGRLKIYYIHRLISYLTGWHLTYLLRYMTSVWINVFKSRRKVGVQTGFIRLRTGTYSSLFWYLITRLQVP
jgi:hypothetical protein